MKIPEFDLVCDLKCVVLNDGDLELTSSSLLEFLSEKTGYILNGLYLILDSELAPPGLMVTYDGWNPDEDFFLFEVELTDADLSCIEALY